MTPTLLIASQNAHKIEELKPLLEQAGFAVTDARDVKLKEPVEDGKTFVDNARIKAIAAVKATGMAVLADDSGLIIDALRDFPGVDTAPYVKSVGGTDRAVVDICNRLDGRDPACHYVSVLVLHFPDGGEIIAQGRVNGRLIRDGRGAGTFGFDPWFLVDGMDKTFAELTTTEKNRLSHRGLALQDLLRQLKDRHDLRAVS